jgi:hypothetical protein
LRNGVYEELTLDAQRRFVSNQLGLALIRWQGVYKDVEAHWLRCATLDGVLLPTTQEAAEQKASQAEQEAVQAKQKAVQAKQRAAQLAKKFTLYG